MKLPQRIKCLFGQHNEAVGHVYVWSIQENLLPQIQTCQATSYDLECSFCHKYLETRYDRALNRKLRDFSYKLWNEKK